MSDIYAVFMMLLTLAALGGLVVGIVYTLYQAAKEMWETYTDD